MHRSFPPATGVYSRRRNKGSFDDPRISRFNESQQQWGFIASSNKFDSNVENEERDRSKGKFLVTRPLISSRPIPQYEMRSKFLSLLSLCTAVIANPQNSLIYLWQY